MKCHHRSATGAMSLQRLVAARFQMGSASPVAHLRKRMGLYAGARLSSSRHSLLLPAVPAFHLPRFRIELHIGRATRTKKPLHLLFFRHEGSYLLRYRQLADTITSHKILLVQQFSPRPLCPLYAEAHTSVLLPAHPQMGS